MAHKGLKKAAIAWVLLSMLTFAHAAQTQLHGEIDQLKVAFVYNFSKYFTWPTTEKWTGSSDFNICIDNALVAGGRFPGLNGQVTQNKTIRILDLSQSGIDVAEQCHIWYIAGEDYPARQELILATLNADVLTISDRENFTALGGVLELVIVQSKIKFRVNTRNAKSKGLEASSFLLRLALPSNPM